MRRYDSLRRQAEIARVRRRGRSASFATLTAYAEPPAALRARVGVTVSKSVGKAVVRNLVRRRIRGALDAMPEVTLPARLLVVAKPAAAAVSYRCLAADLSAALARLAKVAG